MKITHSLTFKTLVIVVVTLLAINFIGIRAIRGMFADEQSIRRSIEPLVNELALALLNRFGSPPNPATIATFEANTGARVLLATPEGRFGSSPFSINELERETFRHHSQRNLKFGHFQRSYFAMLRIDSRTLAIIVRPGETYSSFRERHLIFAFTTITLIIVLGFAALRQLYRPLKSILASVQAIGAGKFDTPLIVKRRDELGLLANAVDATRQQIKTMLASREQMLLDVSHELRSPLTRLRVGLELLPNTASLVDDVNEMDKLIGGILTHAREGHAPAKLTRLDLAKVFDGLRQQFEFDLARAPNEPPVTADPEKLQTVLRNVLQNCTKYAPKSPKPQIRTTVLGDKVEIAIRDYGPGVATDELERIFEPFFRTDPSRTPLAGGYGLGLSLCRRMMGQMQGDIRAKLPADGPGLVVTITIASA